MNNPKLDFFYPKRVCFEGHIICKQEIRLTLILQIQGSYNVIDTFNLRCYLDILKASSLELFVSHFLLVNKYSIWGVWPVLSNTARNEATMAWFNAWSVAEVVFPFYRHEITNLWITVLMQVWMTLNIQVPGRMIKKKYFQVQKKVFSTD